ncbi:hemerythrin domain-containing protein [Catellatospora vulcania]|uniref:hemerythrin domain-containing protein n=1 Tax=Catellatospora vulcania TaxID=1460450 RepID=UPI0012D43FBD|nr:hemerythrin domain-containing protein [Catellatospora vulcania]
MSQREPADDETTGDAQAEQRGRTERDAYRMKVQELRALLREKGVPGTSQMHKDELVRELVKTVHSDQRARTVAKVATGKKSVVPPDDQAPSSKVPKPPRPAKRVPAAAAPPPLPYDPGDVIDLLLVQHQQLGDLFDELDGVRGARRRDLFAELVRLLAVHESIEQLLVHPLARARLSGGDAVVDARTEEEDQAEQDLVELYELGLEHDDFEEKLANLRDAVIEHGELEEEEEFDALREHVPAEELRRLGAIAVAATDAVMSSDDAAAPDEIFALARESFPDP